MGPLARLTILLAAVYPALVVSDAPAVIPRISTISFSGNGCRSDPRYTGGFSDLTVSFSEFNATLASGKTLNCEVQVQATGGSPGWQVSVRDVWVKGHAWLRPDTYVEYFTTASFSQDAAKTVTVRNRLSNDGSAVVSKDVTFHNDLSGHQVWSPCFGGDGYTGILVVNSRVGVNGDGDKASFEAWTQNWALDWRRC